MIKVSSKSTIQNQMGKAHRSLLGDTPGKKGTVYPPISTQNSRDALPAGATTALNDRKTVQILEAILQPPKTKSSLKTFEMTPIFFAIMLSALKKLEITELSPLMAFTLLAFILSLGSIAKNYYQKKELTALLKIQQNKLNPYTATRTPQGAHKPNNPDRQPDIISKMAKANINIRRAKQQRILKDDMKHAQYSQALCMLGLLSTSIALALPNPETPAQTTPHGFAIFFFLISIYIEKIKRLETLDTTIKNASSTLGALTKYLAQQIASQIAQQNIQPQKLPDQNDDCELLDFGDNSTTAYSSSGASSEPARAAAIQISSEAIREEYLASVAQPDSRRSSTGSAASFSPPDTAPGTLAGLSPATQAWTTPAGISRQLSHLGRP